VAVARHDLVTTMSGLHGYADLLAHYLHEDLASDLARTTAERILHISQRLIAMIHNAFGPSAGPSGQYAVRREIVDVREVVTDAVEIAQMLPNAQLIHIDVPDGSIMITGDRRRLGDAVLNLLANALKHAPGTDRIDVRLRIRDAVAQLEVEDYGPGMPPDDLERIFANYYRGSHSAIPASEG